MSRRAAGLLTRGSLPRRLPDLAASGVPAWERLPSQRRDRPGFAPGSLTARLSGPSLSWPRDDSAAAILALGACCALGLRDLRALLDSVAFERARRLGRGAAKGRAPDRVRDPRRAALPRSRPHAAGLGARDPVRGHRRAPPGLRAGPPLLAVRRRVRRVWVGARPIGRALRTIAA